MRHLSATAGLHRGATGMPLSGGGFGVKMPVWPLIHTTERRRESLRPGRLHHRRRGPPLRLPGLANPTTFRAGPAPTGPRVGAYRVVAAADLPLVEKALLTAGYLPHESGVSHGG